MTFPNPPDPSVGQRDACNPCGVRDDVPKREYSAQQELAGQRGAKGVQLRLVIKAGEFDANRDRNGCLERAQNRRARVDRAETGVDRGRP